MGVNVYEEVKLRTYCGGVNKFIGRLTLRVRNINKRILVCCKNCKLNLKCYKIARQLASLGSPGSCWFARYERKPSNFLFGGLDGLNRIYSTSSECF